MPVLIRIIGFVTTSNPEKAKAFYGDVLGFRLISEDAFALAYDANGTMVRVGKAQAFTPAQAPSWAGKSTTSTPPSGS